jgi:acyl carrier protein
MNKIVIFNITYYSKTIPYLKTLKNDKMEELKKVILEYVIAEYLEDEDEKLTYESRLISSGIVDSFSMVSLKRFLENKYKISIPDEKASPEAFDTVTKIANLVTEFLNK